MIEYRGAVPYSDSWYLVWNLDLCLIISKNSGKCEFEEPYDNPFIDFYCELDAYLINQPVLGITGYEVSE